MKKYVYFLIVCLISVFSISSVKAISSSPTTNSYYDIYYDIYRKKDTIDLDKINQKIDYYVEIYKYTFPYYFVYCNERYDEFQFYIYFFSDKPTFEYNVYNNGINFYSFINLTGGTFNYFYNTNYFHTMPNSYTVVSGWTPTDVKPQSNILWSSIYLTKTNEKYGEIKFDSNSKNANFIYDSNFEITKANESAYSSDRKNIDIKIGDLYYTTNDIVPSFREVFMPKDPTVYTYENFVETETLNYIKLKFDTNYIVNNDNYFQLDYSINNMVLDGEKNDLPKPYVEIYYNDNGNYIYETVDIDYFSGNIFEELSSKFVNSSYINFVIDTRTYNDILELNFSSFIPYNVVFYNTLGTQTIELDNNVPTVNDTFNHNNITLNLDIHLGVYLRPKLKQNNIYVEMNSNIFLKGIYDIDLSIINTRNEEIVVNNWFDYDSSIFTHRFHYDFNQNYHNNYGLTFLKKGNEETYTITFDANMFYYSYIYSLEDIIEIPDINDINNTTSTNINDIYNQQEEDKLNESVNDKIDNLNNISNVFFNNFINYGTPIFDMFNTIWNVIIVSSIYRYLMIIIFGSIIIYLIKLFKG